MYLREKTKIALLWVKIVIIMVKYLYFADIFFKKLTKILSQHIKINTQVINWKNRNWPPYMPIYYPECKQQLTQLITNWSTTGEKILIVSRELNA